jgi:hypothetical protein
MATFLFLLLGVPEEARASSLAPIYSLSRLPLPVVVERPEIGKGEIELCGLRFEQTAKPSALSNVELIYVIDVPINEHFLGTSFQSLSLPIGYRHVGVLEKVVLSDEEAGRFLIEIMPNAWGDLGYAHFGVN